MSAIPPTLLVVPTYNEAQNIETLIDPVERVRVDLPADVLVVDDGSPDGTAERVRTFQSKRPWVHLLMRSGPQGLGSAYRAGFRWGLDRRYDRIGEMDADLSHDPAAIPALSRALDGGAALAIGSRYVVGGTVEGWPLSRRMLSRGANVFARTLLRLPVRDVTAGFRLYTAQAVRHVLRTGTTCDGYGFQVEAVTALTRSGFEIAEVPIDFRDREFGTSKMSLKITIEAAKRCWQLARSRPSDATPEDLVLPRRTRSERVIVDRTITSSASSPIGAADGSRGNR
jgi:dolichol-phosphate mannosyltransferase